MDVLHSPLFIQSTAGQSFDLSHGFLPAADPLLTLPSSFAIWENTARDLPKLLVSQHTRITIENLPTFPLDAIKTGAELERAMMLLSYLGHAYVWGEATPPTTLPAAIAMPWFEIGKQLGRPPVLSYASYALYNWRRIDPKGPIALGNIALLQNFLGGVDEEWFVLIHIDIEYRAIAAMQAILAAQQAVTANDSAALIEQLQIMVSSLQQMVATLKRMPEHCDPYIYYNRVRPYIHGWKDNPALPDGLIYEGVAEYAGQPMKFKGETGAQSTIIPALDAILGVGHAESPLSAHLHEMRIYMPASHRAFLEFIEQGPSVRDYVLQHHIQHEALRMLYNQCLELIHEFRATHLHYAASYIYQQHQKSLSNPTAVGTGGTPFMTYLHKHEVETQKHLI